MMNYIWASLIIISIITALFNGNINTISNSLLESIENAVEFSIKLLGMFCFWGGITKIAEKSGFINIISKLMSPILHLLFKDIDNNRELKKSISMSITANLLGIGNAATPLGLKAMNNFEKNKLHPEVATDNMVIFVVMNTAALRLIPTTIAMIRSSYGSQSPFEILPATIITSFCSLTVGITLAKILGGRKYE